MLKDIYNQTITILNKLKRSDGVTGLDVWYKHIVTDGVWYVDSARSAGSSTVYMGSYITIFIPFHNDYLPYSQWKLAGNQDNYFTASQGDYAILGTIDEEVTANNIVKVLQKYGENVCLIRHHNENYNRFGAKVQLKIQGVPNGQ